MKIASRATAEGLAGHGLSTTGLNHKVVRAINLFSSSPWFFYSARFQSEFVNKWHIVLLITSLNYIFPKIDGVIAFIH